MRTKKEKDKNHLAEVNGTQGSAERQKQKKPGYLCELTQQTEKTRRGRFTPIRSGAAKEEGYSSVHDKVILSSAVDFFIIIIFSCCKLVLIC